MASNPHIITLEEGWDNQIKKKVRTAGGGGGGGRLGGRDLFLPRTLALILYWGLRGVVGLDC